MFYTLSQQVILTAVLSRIMTELFSLVYLVPSLLRCGFRLRPPCSCHPKPQNTRGQRKRQGDKQETQYSTDFSEAKWTRIIVHTLYNVQVDSTLDIDTKLKPDSGDLITSSRNTKL